MSEEFDKEVCDLKMCTLKDILGNHENKLEGHDVRIKALELVNVENRLEFASLKQSQSDQKALILDLDRQNKISNDKQFEKIILAQGKIENANIEMFNKMLDGQQKMIDSQTTIFNGILTNRSEQTTGKVEITKTRFGLYTVGLGGVISIIMFVLEKLLG
jgi:hypothetical protein